jgi:hypothetical protein
MAITTAKAGEKIGEKIGEKNVRLETTRRRENEAANFIDSSTYEHYRTQPGSEAAERAS